MDATLLLQIFAYIMAFAVFSAIAIYAVMYLVCVGLFGVRPGAILKEIYMALMGKS